MAERNNVYVVRGRPRQIGRIADTFYFAFGFFHKLMDVLTAKYMTVAECPVAPVNCRTSIDSVVDEYLTLLRSISKRLNHLGGGKRLIKVVEKK
jgi:hypothetical protein